MILVYFRITKRLKSIHSQQDLKDHTKAKREAIILKKNLNIETIAIRCYNCIIKILSILKIIITKRNHS